MTHEKIVKSTFAKFYGVTAVATIGTAVMSLLNIFIASFFFGGDGSYVMGIALPLLIFNEIIVYFFGVGGGIAVSVSQGRGETKRASQIFSLSIVSTVAIGVLVAVIATPILPDLLSILGARTLAEQAVVSNYFRISLYGMPVVLLFGVMTVFVRNDNNPRFAMLCTVFEIFVDLLLLFVFIRSNMQLYSVALATVAANGLALILYFVYFLGKRSTLKLTKKIDFSCFRDICSPGLSGSMIFFTQTILTVIINNVLLKTNGQSGIGAYAVVKYAITLIYGIYDSVTHSAQPMFGVYYGEKDKLSITQTAKVAYRFMLISAILLCVVFVIASPFISSYFKIEATDAIRLIGISCLFSSAVTFLNGYYRATGKSTLSILITVLDNLVFPALLVYLFVYPMNMTENGVWLALVVSEVFTLILIVAITKGKFLLCGSLTQESDKVYEALILNESANIVAINGEIEQFCEGNGIGKKKQYYIFLCIEEIAVNIITHGFKDGKEHYIDIKLIASGDDVLLNIRDDAIGFDPTQKIEVDITSSAEERDIGGLGIYLVKKVSKEFSYKRVIGFNNLHIVL